MKTDDVIMHQQIMHTWASFALEHDLDFYNEETMRSMVEWTEEAIEALKEHGTQVQYRDDHIAEYEKEIKRLNKLLKEQEELLKHEYWRGYNNGRANEIRHRIFVSRHL